MNQPEPHSQKLRFGLFEADLKAGELRKAGVRVRLQAQPFKVLCFLLEYPGELVTREQLQQVLWSGTTVDFDHSLGTAINKIREALGDSASNPRFVETLAKRGYRFIAPVTSNDTRAQTEPLAAQPEGVGRVDAEATTAPEDTCPPQPTPTERLKPRWLRGITPKIALVASAVLGCLLLAALPTRQEPFLPTMKMSQVTFSGHVSPGNPDFESLPAMVTDGSRIYFFQIERGKAKLAEASLTLGSDIATIPLPSEIAAPSFGDISRDGSKLLIRNHLAPETEQPIWIVPTRGGAARRVANILAHDATWMRDGLHLLYATGNDLYIANENGGEIRKFASLPGRAFWLRWSPDESKLRFTLISPTNHTSSLWEIAADGSDPHELFPQWSSSSSVCCGNWTVDGKYYLFQSNSSGLPSTMSSLWGMQEKFPFWQRRKSSPAEITNGPLSYAAPVAGKIGHRLFFLGVENRFELMAYQPKRQQFAYFRGDLHLTGRVEFSRDGQWVAWIKPEDGSLWRSRANGTDRMQLIAPPTQVFLAHWSPDATQLAVMVRNSGQPWSVSLISATGGELHPIPKEDRNQADPDWSPDGKSIVFGRVPELMASESAPKFIHLLDLQSQRSSVLPKSEGLFSPRWSPDGRYIAATTLDQRKLMLFDTQTQTWKVLAERSVADATWSHDGRSLFFYAFMEDGQPIFRVSVPAGNIERVAGMDNVDSFNIVDYTFSGLTPEDIPLIRARAWTANVYSIDLERSAQ